jgi:hypothetical protein
MFWEPRRQDYTEKVSADGDAAMNALGQSLKRLCKPRMFFIVQTQVFLLR